MSGKSARRLRRLAEQATGSEKGSTSKGEYKEHKVPARQYGEYGPVSTTVRLDRKEPRAFYKEAKRAYKTGEAQAESVRIKKEFREEQKAAAKRFADVIEDSLKKNEELYAQQK